MVSSMSRQAVVPEELRCGPFTVAEAMQAGLTRRQLRSASWRRITTGLYVWAEVAESPTLVLAAACRRLPPGAAFSGRTAAWLHGLDVPPCDPVEVTVPCASGVATRAGVRVRRSILGQSDVVVRRGLPATSILRTVFDLSRWLPFIEAVVAVDMALHRGLVDRDRLRAHVAEHPPCGGLVQARRVVELAEPAAESPMESRLRILLVRGGLPRPHVQVPLATTGVALLGVLTCTTQPRSSPSSSTAARTVTVWWGTTAVRIGYSMLVTACSGSLQQTSMLCQTRSWSRSAPR